MLPASELYHLADLVCVMSCGGDGSSIVSVMAVSPEGLVRYWPSLVHDNAVMDMETDLIGSQCHSLTAFQVCHLPGNDQLQISPCNIYQCLLNPKVMRIKDMITKGEFS